MEIDEHLYSGCKGQQKESKFAERENAVYSACLPLLKRPGLASSLYFCLQHTILSDTGREPPSKDKLLLFVEEVLEKIKNFDGPTESEFARALDGLKREQVTHGCPRVGIGQWEDLERP